MGRDKPPLGKLPEIERRLCDNVLRRLPKSAQKTERVELEDEFSRIAYDLLKMRRSDFKSYPSIHPSEVGGCPLRIAFGLRGFERRPSLDPDPRMLLRFEIGHAIHEIFQSRYELFQGRVNFENEVKITPETSEIAEIYSVTGHCDGVFTEIATSIRMGLEIKSMSGKSFTGTKLSDHYKKQATMYMACLDLSHMMFLFVNKDNARVESILYKFDDALWKEIQDKLDGILLKVITGKPVEREVNRIVCKTMCSFYWACRPEV